MFTSAASSPHKNLERLVRAFVKITAHESFSNVKLVMVGEYKRETFHSYYGTIKALIGKLGVAEKVVLPGYLSDEKLVNLLNFSSVCVLPSLIEGFGLPAVEAAACGCPVIATKESRCRRYLRMAEFTSRPRAKKNWKKR
ncbi:MAG: glycosyltransferase [Pyrinomonadaceae bacterium]